MIPVSEFKERVVRLQAEMAKEGFDYILAYGNEAEPQYVRYFSDYWPSFALFLNLMRALCLRKCWKQPKRGCLE